MSSLLSAINSPADLKKIPLENLPALAQEMRELIMNTVGANGGHLAPNLGTVEICIALNIVFNFQKDRMLWDVGHQCYPHKLLTGRAKNFSSLRKKGGVCGFPDPLESPYDLFAVGHAGTGISTAVGMARADQLQNRDTRVVALVGDASIVNGLAFEGLNNAGTLKRQMLIILNDNSMSISEPQGAFANYLEHLRVTTTYDEVKKRVTHLLEQIPYGQQISDIAYHVKQGLKNTIAPGHIFEDLGLKYFGPVDGHDLPGLIEKLNELKDLQTPAVLHIKTVKGKGYEWACDDPTTFHSPKPFRVEGCRVVLEKGSGRSWTAAFADAMVNLSKKNEKIVGITAAMPDGTGMIKLKPVFPDRYFDTGICESHAATMAAGMTKAGLRPVVAIYSTFLQRAFDQIFQEVCLQGLPVVFCADRAGLVGDDGAVHHGFGDLTFLRSLPGMVLLAPSDEQELIRALDFATTLDAPTEIRYPRDNVPPAPLGEDSAWTITKSGGKARTLRTGADATIIAYGSVAWQALEAAKLLANDGISVGVVDARFCKPLDSDMLKQVFTTANQNGTPILTVEDHSVVNGFGTAVVEHAAEKRYDVRQVTRLGLPDRFIKHASRPEQFKEVGLDAAGIASSVRAAVEESRRVAESTSVIGTAPVRRAALRT
ncbi:MAG TPA: 1-deoxy-D-xylulose-5-phosphate synthase [Phycisphaerae bacterium]|nr:1-deoxy-D-xylulose-5-phosphate synthase [Phycisphaerae bacterium]